MKRSGIKRKTRLRAVNPARRRRVWVEQYGSPARVDWVSRQPCVVCGATPSENAHVRSRGAGGKASDIVPLCRKHHREQHLMGIRSFEDEYDILLRPIAAETDIRWRAWLKRSGEQNNGGERWPEVI